MTTLQEKQNSIFSFDSTHLWGSVLFQGENKLSDEQLKKMFLILDEKQVDSLLSHLGNEAVTPRNSDKKSGFEKMNKVCDNGHQIISGWCECHGYQKLSVSLL